MTFRVDRVMVRYYLRTQSTPIMPNQILSPSPDDLVSATCVSVPNKHPKHSQVSINNSLDVCFVIR